MKRCGTRVAMIQRRSSVVGRRGTAEQLVRAYHVAVAWRGKVRTRRSFRCLRCCSLFLLDGHVDEVNLGHELAWLLFSASFLLCYLLVYWYDLEFVPCSVTTPASNLRGSCMFRPDRPVPAYLRAVRLFETTRSYAVRPTLGTPTVSAAR